MPTWNSAPIRYVSAESNLPPTNRRRGRTMDLVITRSSTEGFHPDRNMTRGWGEMMLSPDTALSFRKVARHASERIARRSLERATARRKKVAAVHKANSFHVTDGRFLECVRHVHLTSRRLSWTAC